MKTFNLKNIIEEMDVSKLKMITIIMVLTFILAVVTSFFIGYTIASATTNMQCYEELRVCDIKMGLLDTKEETYTITEDGKIKVGYDNPKWKEEQYLGVWLS